MIHIFPFGLFWMCYFREVARTSRVQENDEEEERFHVTNSLMENRMQHKNSYQQPQQNLPSPQKDFKYRKTVSNKLTQLWLLIEYHGKRQWLFIRKYRYLLIVSI